MGNKNYFEIENNVLQNYYGNHNKNITIPEGVKYILRRVFENHTEIETVKFPKGIEGIGENTFSGCKNLKTINCPNHTIDFTGNPFDNCPNLKNIIINKNSILDKFLFGFYYINNSRSQRSQITEAPVPFIAEEIGSDTIKITQHTPEEHNEWKLKQKEQQYKEQQYNSIKAQVENIVGCYIQLVDFYQLTREKIEEIKNNITNEILEVTNQIPPHLKR